MPKGARSKGVRVQIFEGGLMGGHLKAYTESSGWAELENAASERSDWIVKSISVNGVQISGSTHITNGRRLSFTV